MRTRFMAWTIILCMLSSMTAVVYGESAPVLHDQFLSEAEAFSKMDSHSENLMYGNEGGLFNAVYRTGNKDQAMAQAEARVIYRVENISGFAVDFGASSNSGLSPEHSTFYVSADKKTWTQIPAETAEQARHPEWTSIKQYAYTGSVAAGGMNYLKIQLGKCPKTAYQLRLHDVKIYGMTEAEALESQDIQNVLAWEKFSPDQPQNQIIKDLTLPVQVTGAYANGSVRWTSSNESVITAAGKVIRGDENQAVSLTAEVSYNGGKTARFQYDLIVMRIGADSEIFDPCDDLSMVFDHSANVEAATNVDYAVETHTVIREKNGSLLNGSEYITYRADNMTEVQVDVLENTRGGDKRMKFQTSKDGISFEDFDGYIKSTPVESSKTRNWFRASYTLKNLPDETNYLRMYFGAQTDGKYWSFGIDQVTICQDTMEYAYEWPADQVITTVPYGDGVKIDWSPLHTAEPIRYEIYESGVKVGETENCSITLASLAAGRVCKFYVKAVNREDSERFSRMLSSGQVRIGHDRGTLLEAGIDLTGGWAELQGLCWGASASASARLQISDDTVFGADGWIRFGFAHTYIKVWKTKTEYYKNDVKVAEVRSNTANTGMVLELLTDNGEIREDRNLYLVKENVTGDITAADVQVWKEPDGQVFIEEASPALPYRMEFDNAVSAGFTLEAEVFGGESSPNTLDIQLISDTEFNGGSAYLAKYALSTKEMACLSGGFENNRWNSSVVYTGVSFQYLPEVRPNCWEKIKIYVDPVEKTMDYYVNCERMAEKLDFANELAADLKGISISSKGGWKIRNVRLTDGYAGAFYHRPAVYGPDGKPAALVSPGDAVTVRIDYLAETAPDVIADHNGAYLDGRNMQIDVQEDGWKTASIPVTAADDSIRVYAWSSLGQMRPVTRSGGYTRTEQSGSGSHNLFLIGDSTVHYVSNPCVGWGEIMGDYVTDQIRIYNYAKDGRSTGTYLGNGRLNIINNKLNPGDYIFCQLGHNDTINGPKGTTEAEYRENLTEIVRFARQRGANLMFITPPVRKNELNNAVKNNVPLWKRAVIMMEVAEEYGVPYIDLYSKTWDEFKGSQSGNLSSIYWNNGSDNQHFTDSGARLVFSYIMELCREKNVDFVQFLR